MRYAEHASMIQHVRDLSLGEQMVLRAVWLKILYFGKSYSLLPRSEIVKLSGVSAPTAKAALDKLCGKKILNRTYVCGNCCAGLGIAYVDRWQFERCPVCGERLSRNVWVKLELSPWGKDLASYMCEGSIQEEKIPFPPEIQAFSHKAADILGCPSQWELLARRISKDKPTHLERELALAYAYKCHVEHSCRVVYSLPALFNHALETIRSHQRDDLERDVYIPIWDRQRAAESLKSILVTVDYCEAKDDVKMFYSCVGYVYELYRDMAGYWDELDRITILSGRQPRTLQLHGEDHRFDWKTSHGGVRVVPSVVC